MNITIKLKTTLILLLLIFELFIFPDAILGLSNLEISGSTRISICGNKEIEGGEDCEGINVDNQTCLSIGMSQGDLSCDIACSFETYGCGLVPTATLAPETVPTKGVTPTAVATATVLTNILTSSLPKTIVTFDVNGDGKIASSELYSVVQRWVDQWKSKEKISKNCDINTDNKCDVVDFSILMSYIEK